MPIRVCIVSRYQLISIKLFSLRVYIVKMLKNIILSADICYLTIIELIIRVRELKVYFCNMKRHMPNQLEQSLQTESWQCLFEMNTPFQNISSNKNLVSKKEQKEIIGRLHLLQRTEQKSPSKLYICNSTTTKLKQLSLIFNRGF